MLKVVGAFLSWRPKRHVKTNCAHREMYLSL